MLSLLHAEWLKISRRPLAWSLLIVFLALMLLYFSMVFLVVALHDGLLSGGDRMALLREEHILQYRLQLRFPGIFGAVFSQVNGIGGICAVVLAAGALGSEYSWGTLRTQLARRPERGQYLVAKCIGLLLALVVSLVIVVVVGALAGLLFGSLLGNVGTVSASDLLLLPLAMLRALYVMLPYVMFTMACCIFGRSALAGIAGGMVFLIFDNGMGALSIFSGSSGLLAFLYSLALQQNIHVFVMLNSAAYGLDPAIVVGIGLQHLPSLLQATLVVAVYSGLFFGYAYYWLIRRDVTGAA